MNTKQTFFCALIFALVGLFFSGCHDDYRYGAGVEENGTNNDVNNIDDVVSNPLVTCEANDTRTIDPDGNSSTVVTVGGPYLVGFDPDDFYGPYPDMIASTNGVILMLGVGDGIRLKRIVCTKE